MHLPPETELRSMLAARYVDALQTGLTEALRQSDNLSGVFMPDVFSAYAEAPLRVMLIGKETRGGFGHISQLRNPVFSAPHGELDAYTQQSMARWKDIDQRAPGKSQFGQFRERLDRALSTRAQRPVRHHWANLFCLDHAESSPVGSPHFAAIQSLSRKLLKIQIDVLRPHVLLFTTGVGSTSYDKHIKEMLTVTDSSFGTDRHIKGQLWEFRVNGIAAYRTAHPRWAPGKLGRDAALARIFSRRDLQTVHSEMEPSP